MNKKELIDAIADGAGLTKSDASGALDAFVDAVTKTLKKKGTVVIVGFGTFKTSRTSARDGRNPQTGETIKIKAKTVPKFQAGKSLKDAVNK